MTTTTTDVPVATWQDVWVMVRTACTAREDSAGKLTPPLPEPMTTWTSTPGRRLTIGTRTTDDAVRWLGWWVTCAGAREWGTEPPGAVMWRGWTIRIVDASQPWQ
jgi:hypothetical protein